MTASSSSPTGVALGALGALGVVYGDIGTSPLYALRECFHGPHAIALDSASVLGVLSLVTWSLIIVVTIKYLLYVMRADNDGEGGILALLALALHPDRSHRKQWLVGALGIFGAALLYGDGIITPAISVLSAVEGLRVEAPALDHLVVPLTVAILFVLFVVQSRGTERVGLVFGPIMLLWLVVLMVLGATHIVQRPDVLVAVDPRHAVQFFQSHGLAGVVVLGAVFLCVTGGEALYADMGHFGRSPIRWAWMVVVLPALLIAYYGQGALLLDHPEAIEHPIMHMAPVWARYPLLVLSALAAVIASQALISGTFSLSRQAVAMGYSPRLKVVHTSPELIGQIYMPTVNWAMMIGTIALVVGFGSSSNLAAAYGIAVTATMVITTLLAHVVARRRWGWSLLAAGALTVGLVSVDLAFLSANAIKIPHGGWVALLVAVLVFVLMTTWRRGREILAARIGERSIPLTELPAWIDARAPACVPGTAVYMTGHPESTPLALVANVTHNRAMHERVILLSVVFTQNARVSVANRLRVERLHPNVVRLVGYYGFVERPDVPSLLELAVMEGIEVDPQTVSFVMGRETLLATDRPGMSRWRESLFAFMSRNAQRAASFFGIPSEHVLEVGSQIEL